MFSSTPFISSSPRPPETDSNVLNSKMLIRSVVVFVSVVQISMIRASCPPGRFGDSCLYSCNCGTSCDQETGVCPGVCDLGWVKGGGLCQKKNIAYNKHASSNTNSEYPNWPPRNAVDGDNDIHGDSRTCFHADFGPSEWTVDLGREYLLHDIRAYLRYGKNRRIVNSFIFVDNKPSSICYTFPSNVSNIINPTDLVCSTTARYITIKNPGTGDWDDSPLNICEVEIYTCCNGTYGRNCTEFCHCSGCNQWSGICSGDCRPGWKGEGCDTACVSTYGINCAKRCEDRHCAPGSSCDRYTGLCVTGCQPGWIDDDCTEKCNSDHYGMNCSYKCSERNCLPTSTCFHGTGSCDHGCRAGWQGQDCRQECDTGRYGRNCKEMCASRQCIGTSSCNHITGECVGGCKQEWDGIACTECITGRYGRNCTGVCASRQCIGTSECNYITGECIGGCKQGWDGIDCTVENVKKAPATALIAGSTGTVAFVMLIVMTICVVLWIKRRTVKNASENVCYKSEVTNNLPKENNDATDLYASIDDNEVRGKGQNSVEYDAKSDLPARSVYEDLESESRDHNEDYTDLHRTSPYVNT